MARLRMQTAELIQQYSDPVSFIRSLHTLYNYYSDRTYRPGQSGEPPPLLFAYNVPDPILREITRELSPILARDKSAALALLDQLWIENCLEFRLLAAILLGLIDPNPVGPIVERVKTWANPSTESRLLDTILSNGLENIRRNVPKVNYDLIAEWISSQDSFHKHIGLRAILPLINTPFFVNIPVFFQLITPFVRIVPPALRSDLVDVLRALTQHSPQETAYFLRQVMAMPENPDTAWMIRQCLNEFDPEIQGSLRSAIRDAIAQED
jgi:hypothetical protein